jgi:acyl-coenzyme A thioesterase PaaI-like protein
MSTAIATSSPVHCGFRETLHSEKYHRIDEKFLRKHASHLESSAIHGTLRGSETITRYEIYQKEDQHEIAALVEIGDNLCGHPGLVHGGIISALFDNTLGWLFIAMQQPPAFTANLNVNYRKPMPSNTTAVIKAHVTNVQGRKIFVNATWERDGQVFADATALFITPKPEQAPPPFASQE